MDDIHIKILKLLRKHSQGLTQSEIADKLNINPNEIRWAYEEAGNAGKILIRTGDRRNGEQIIFLGMHGRAILLQHSELKHARASSTRATSIAIGALIVAIIVGCFRVFVPSKLNNEQLEKILQSESDLHKIINQIDSLRIDQKEIKRIMIDTSNKN